MSEPIIQCVFFKTLHIQELYTVQHNTMNVNTL
jgi:hypothetical protein